MDGTAGPIRTTPRPHCCRTCSSGSAADVGKATVSLVVNSNDAILDDIWAWRADHGNAASAGPSTRPTPASWSTATTSLATGLFVEHYQNYEVQLVTANGGGTIFFQNEMPYDPPNQAAWMNG